MVIQKTILNIQVLSDISQNYEIINYVTDKNSWCNYGI